MVPGPERDGGGGRGGEWKRKEAVDIKLLTQWTLQCLARATINTFFVRPVWTAYSTLNTAAELRCSVDTHRPLATVDTHRPLATVDTQRPLAAIYSQLAPFAHWRRK